MALEDDDAIRRLLARRPRPRLSDDFASELLRRVRQQSRAPQRGVGPRLALGAYWLAAAAGTAWILRQGSLPGWMSETLWAVALALVPVSYALVLWGLLCRPPRLSCMA